MLKVPTISPFSAGMAEASYQELVLRNSIEGTRVEDVTVRDVVTASPDLPVQGLISDFFLRYGYRGFPVTMKGDILGVISLANVKDMSEQERARKSIGEAMTPLERHMIITPETSLAEALTRMSQNKLGRLLIMRDDEMVGLITETGLLRLLEIKRTLETSESTRQHYPEH